MILHQSLNTVNYRSSDSCQEEEEVGGRDGEITAVVGNLTMIDDEDDEDNRDYYDDDDHHRCDHDHGDGDNDCIGTTHAVPCGGAMEASPRLRGCQNYAGKGGEHGVVVLPCFFFCQRCCI